MPEIKVPAKIERLREMVQLVADCARSQGFSKEKIGEIELMAEEVLVNVINYAYPKKEGDVEVFCNTDAEDRLVVRISDNGVPFDPLAASRPDLSLDIKDRQIGGLGIFFVRQMADEVKYVRDGQRNILTLTIGP